MLNEIKCNVWDKLDENSAVCILTNDMIRNGENIMGGGIAREAADRNPGLKRICAEAIIQHKFSMGFDRISGAELLRFSTKDVVWQPSKLNMIEQCLVKLSDYCKTNPNKAIYLPRPGCGLGGLDWETEVKPLCEKYLSDLNNLYITYM